MEKVPEEYMTEKKRDLVMGLIKCTTKKNTGSMN